MKPFGVLDAPLSFILALTVLEEMTLRIPTLSPSQWGKIPTYVGKIPHSNGEVVGKAVASSERTVRKGRGYSFEVSVPVG